MGWRCEISCSFVQTHLILDNGAIDRRLFIRRAVDDADELRERALEVVDGPGMDSGGCLLGRFAIAR
jgi:hypothetical protein